MGNLSKLLGPMLEEWTKEAQEERSRTWKERHAKGTPVSLSPTTPRPKSGSVSYGIRNDGSLQIYVSGAGKVIATFCNFRYKG